MPRLPRIYIEGALYYTTCRGAHEQKLFKEKKDYQMYIELLKKYRKEYNFKLFAYALLPNHIHLLIEPSQKATISEIMHALNTSYSKYYNSAYQRRGHLFRERFKACLVEKEPYLARLTSYIHLNPQKLGLAEKAEDYPFSSLPIYIDRSQDFEEELKEVLGYIKEENYLDYLKRQTTEELPELHKYLQRKGMIGSKDFVQRMKELIRKKEEEAEKEAPSYRKMVLFISLGLALIILGVALGVNYFFGRKKIQVSLEKKEKEVLRKPFIIKEIRDLDSTEWQIKLTSLNEGKSYPDTLTFAQGKFVSAYLSGKGFKPTNYSASQENNKIIWETIQTSSYGTASWRGEITANKMRGIASLRSKEKSEDFSFVSLSLRRKK